MLIIRHPRNFQDTFVQTQVYIPCYYLQLTSDCYTLRVPAICPYYSHIVRLRRPFMLIIRHPRNFQDTFVQAQVSWKFRGLVSYMSFVSSSFSITKLFSFIIGFLSINPSISDGIRNNSSLDISVQYVFPYIPAIVSLIAPML